MNSPWVQYIKKMIKMAEELINKAEDLFESGKFEEAIMVYTEVINQRKYLSLARLTYVFYMRGRAYKATGDLDKARQDWRTTQQLKDEGGNPWPLAS
ncbi:tetratricopeptide repeat domain protein [Microscilla marina ATCC 23134]|uniref:Tetratricopeptide repeat domain protein n=2 Tax=Microscilla marina TaxID=1027 RepID=A1ZFV8_MICM2|nr:tetratricopeptide repeat domain protein [Microscilla marina ATCC 23134]